MSGHSKWSTIKRKKGALDAKRAKIFTKLLREISIAVKEGGSDPDGNPRLRLAIQNAKGQNVPKDNIERAIHKGEGGDEGDYTELTYEGYASHGIAIYVECATDNLNRTVAAVRAAFSKYGGGLAVNGSVDYLFERKGIFDIKRPENSIQDELMLKLIDAGAEDVAFDEEYIHVTTAMEDFGRFHQAAEAFNLECETAELQRLPMNRMTLADEELEDVLKLIEVLEDDDDVQKVYHNLDITNEQLAALS